MTRLFTGLALGLVAGIIDATPMILMKMNKFDCLSAFAHWLVLGILLVYMNMPLPGWLQGLVLGLLAALPVVMGLLKTDPKSIPVVLVFSLILGTLLGMATAKWA